jgi:hypothetical protein
MDAPDAQRLRRRREQLQRRLARQDAARQARALAPMLRARGVRRLSLLPPSRAAALVAPFAHWPARDEHFDWPGIAGHACMWWTNEDDRDAAFARALRDCFAPAARLALVFHTVESALVLGREDALAQARVLLDALYGTLWVVPLRGVDGIVEVEFGDRQVCWRAGAPTP